MNKKLSLAVAAALAMGASAAQAGITIPAGDWTIDIGGNVNAFYTHTNLDGDFDTGDEDTAQTIQTGLLPSALGIGGKTRQNDLDIAFQFTFFTGSDSGSGSAGGSNSLNIRQAYLTFGDKSWGTIKLGRDLGIFGSDAILSDMTLLGVGIGAGSGGTSTLGRIGSGYIYADWVGQISYHSPNWNGFSFAVGVREPWTNGASNGVDEVRNNMGFEGKVSYEWAGDVAGKVWAGYINQKHELTSLNDPSFVAPITIDDSYRSDGWEIGGKASVGGFGLVGYYYNGDGLSGNPGLLDGLAFLSGEETDDDGWYVQGTYTIPGIGTKIGVSYGESNSEDETSLFRYDSENKSWIVGVYHPLTKSLNLVAEYVDNDIDIDDKSLIFPGVNEFHGERKTLSLGAIMFF